MKPLDLTQTTEDAPSKKKKGQKTHDDHAHAPVTGADGITPWKLVGDALFDGRISGVVLPIYENERPPQGLAGHLDWRLGSPITLPLRKGAIQGRLGECTYIPVKKHSRIFHLITVGGGSLSRFGKRGLLPDEAFAAVKKNIKLLQIEGIALSRTDFGGINDDYLKKYLGDVNLWIVQ